MAKIDETYHELLKTILNEGYTYEDPNRKGINRIQINDYKIVHNFKDGFPALTTKKLAWKSIVGELLWILKGDTNIKYLVDNDIPIWNKDAYNLYLKEHLPKNGTATIEEFITLIKQNEKPIYHELGDVGRNYGAQLRDWRGISNELVDNGGDCDVNLSKNIDQLANLIHILKTNPMTTKKTVTFWNPAESEGTALTPCHWSFEVLISPMGWEERLKVLYPDYDSGMIIGRIDRQLEKCDENNIPKYKISLKWHQHSVDTFLGLPFNIAFYGVLCQILAKMCNMVPKGIIGDLSNVHIYKLHLNQVREQLSRDVNKHNKCELLFTRFAESKICLNIDDFLDKVNISDFQLNNYTSEPRIKAEMLPYND